MIKTWRRNSLILAAFAMVPAITQAGVLSPSSVPDPTLVAGQVTLYRDAYGAPHVYAALEEDGFYGFGYALAQDRMRQTMLHWVMIRGELAAKFGRQAMTRENGFDDIFIGQVERSWTSRYILDPLASDKLARAVGWLPAARSNFEKLGPQNQANIQSFLAGFKRYMLEHPERVPAWGLQADQIEPALMMAYRAGEARSASDCRGPAKPESEKKSQSNLWAVWGDRTPNGKAIHVSDPHWDPFTLGPSYYSVRIKAGAMDYMNFPLPNQIYGEGYTPHAAWGATTSDDVNATCYAIETQEADARAYTFDDGVKRMTVEAHTIAVRGEAPVSYEVELTHHNDIRTVVMDRQGRTAYAWSWAMSGRQGLSMETERDLAVKTSLDDIRQAFARANWYAWDNYLISTPDQGALWLRPGRQPIRDAAADPDAKVPGNTSATLWRGVHTLDDLLQVRTPPQDYISLSNINPENVFRDDDDKRWKAYPRYFGVGVYQRNNTRQRRALDILSKAGDFSTDQAIALTLDINLVGADLWRPVFADLSASRDPILTPQLKRMAKVLAGFDGEFERSSTGALYFAELRQYLAIAHPMQVDQLVVAVDRGRPLTAEQKAIVIGSLQAVRDNLIAVFGTDKVTYGEMYRLGTPGLSVPANGTGFLAGYDLPDRFWADIGGLGKASSEQTLLLSGFSPLPDVDGRKYTIFSQTRPYVVDFNRPGVSFSALSYGISEDPKSAHGMDQFALLSQRKLRPDWMRFEDLKANVQSVVVLARSAP